MKCTCCQKPLSGGTDTFGDCHHPMCQECYLEIMSQPHEPLYIYTLRVDEETGLVFHGIRWNDGTAIERAEAR